jgi:arabinan endo-1,5-alpha-L-arabinosidase
LAHYGFDDEQLANTFNAAEKAELKRGGSTSLPALVDDSYQLRNGKVVQLSFGAKDKESYVEIPNPLYGKDLTNGASLSFWLQRADDNLWDALYGFYNPSTQARLFLTGNLYTGYNDNAGTWLDINKPDATTSNVLSGNRWKHVTVVFNPSTLGIRIYVNGINKSGNSDVYNGSINGTSVSSRAAFTAAGYKSILAHISQCEKLYLGKGSFWGSAPVCFDDVMIHNRALGVTEIMAIYNVCNRVHDFSADVESVGIAQLSQKVSKQHTYDLGGRRMPEHATLKPGLYIRNGKKVIIR